jgi:uncharacterized surface protein with fasciclin (FAS1) repeats
MKSSTLFAASLSLAAIGTLSVFGTAHAQGTMVQTNPMSGKPVIAVTSMATPMERYMAGWVYTNLDAREIRRYQAMGYSDAAIKGAANIAMRAGLDMPYVVRLMHESGLNLYSIAAEYNVNTKYVDSDIPGYGVETMMMAPKPPMSGSSSMLMPAPTTTTTSISTTTTTTAVTPAAAAVQGTVVDAITNNPDLSTLAAAIKSAGLTDTLNGAGPFTVFAPSNEAFAKLPAGTVDDWMKPENHDKLVSALTYHVIPGKVMAADVMAMTDPSMPKTVNGATLTVKTTAPVTVNGANVTQTDIVTSNGVIHVIDTVLMPPAATPATPAPAQ